MSEMNSKKRLRVGVLFGGRSGEHEVSLASAASVIRALDPEKYEAVPIGITKDGRWLVGDGAQKMLPEVLKRARASRCRRTQLPPLSFHSLKTRVVQASPWMSCFRFCTAHLEKTAPCRGCSNLLVCRTSARASLLPP